MTGPIKEGGSTLEFARKDGTSPYTASACIVVYNGAEEALAAARSLLACTKRLPLELYLVDNASPDGTGRLLRAEAPKLNGRVQVRCLGQNRGFGAGHNAVLEELSSRYHFVVNPDIQLTEDSVGALCAWMDAHPDVVMATPRLVYPDGTEQYTPKRAPFFRALLARVSPFCKKAETHYLMRDRDLASPQDITFCTGSFFVVRTQVFRQIGGFDEGYFMYVEDADITRKALEVGRVCYAPVTVVTHAWHRATHKNVRSFFRQLGSMARYWHKWGFRF